MLPAPFGVLGMLYCHRYSLPPGYFSFQSIHRWVGTPLRVRDVADEGRRLDAFLDEAVPVVLDPLEGAQV